MSLYQRLVGETNKIPLDTFCSACSEIMKGKLTINNCVEAWSLTATEIEDFTDILLKLGLQEAFPLTIQTMRDSLMLCEEGIAYSTVPALKSRWGMS